MIKNGMRPVHPGEILFEEFTEAGRPADQRPYAGQGPRSSGESCDGDYQGAAWYHGRYGGTSGDVFQHHS